MEKNNNRPPDERSKRVIGTSHGTHKKTTSLPAALNAHRKKNEKRKKLNPTRLQSTNERWSSHTNVCKVNDGVKKKKKGLPL